MNTEQPNRPTGQAIDQYHWIAFQVAQSVYALSIQSVLQIAPMVTITPIPHLPAVVQGAINVHGLIVPVVNLRRHFGLPQVAAHLDTPIIILSTGELTIGLVVDEIVDILSLSAERVLQPGQILPPELHNVLVLQGLAHLSQELVFWLDPAHLFSAQQVKALRQAIEFATEYMMSSQQKEK